jgi:hypothetical protein
METQIAMSKANVKFFGEMQFNGHIFHSMNAGTRDKQVELAYKCNNPACNFEKIVHKQYPVNETVEGRVVKHPGQLAEEDDVIKKKMKEHVGSAVMPNSDKVSIPRETYANEKKGNKI